MLDNLNFFENDEENVDINEFLRYQDEGDEYYEEDGEDDYDEEIDLLEDDDEDDDVEY